LVPDEARRLLKIIYRSSYACRKAGSCLCDIRPSRPHQESLLGEGEKDAEESLPRFVDLIERATCGLQALAGPCLPDLARQVVGPEIVVFDLNELDARPWVSEHKIGVSTAYVGVQVEAPRVGEA
jgi:hypothetical protein